MDKILKVLEYDKIISQVAEKSATSLGKKACQQLVPSYSFSEISFMLAETREAVNSLIKFGNPPFSGIHDISDTLKRSEISSVLSAEELLNLSDTLRGCRLLKTYSLQLDENFTILPDYFNILYTSKTLEDVIAKSIDSADHIADHATPSLAKIRSQIRQMELSVKEKINSIVKGNEYSKYLQENIVTIRNGRYVVPVKQEYRSYVSGLVHDSSSTGSTLFIEPLAIVEANNKIHELYIEEKNEIERILLDLSSKIWPITDLLTVSVNGISKLDLCFSKAEFAITTKSFEPQINTNGYINLKKARHPLIDEKKVVPIDIYIGNEFSTLVITGPNTGGKTVSLKTLGLITLMAYSGLFVPCLESSEIAVFDHIFADIGDEQSIEQSLSTFSAHMTNIIDIIELSNSNSLILIDELGSGTDPVEGAALATAILEYLYKKGCRVIASTHYSELKTYALTTPGIKNASCEFDLKTLNPTYKLIIGIPGKSNAFAISKKLGLDSLILADAEKFITRDKVNFEDVLAELQKDKQNLESEKEIIDKTQKEIVELKRELQERKLQIENYKKESIEKAKEEAKDILLSAEEVAKESIREIKKAKKLNYTEMNKKFDKTRTKIKSQLKKSYTSNLNDDSDFIPFEIKIGASVYIPSLEQNATILSLPDKDNNLFIQAGIIKSKISMKKLRPLINEKETVNNVKISASIETHSSYISPEISLRGLNVEDALYTLDKYINDVLLTNLSSIRIVHGKGEGILKKAVWAYLKTNPHIKNFRIGNFGEGDLGVTIAEIQ